MRIIAVTDISILKQFLMILNSTKEQSYFIQSDYELKTILLIVDHYTLQKSQYSDCTLKKCYIYRISVTNQYIKIF